MNTNPLNKGILTENFVGIGTVTPEMVQKRAVELALINGRAAADVSQSDWEQAKRDRPAVGHLYLFLRLVAKGNYSRIGIAASNFLRLTCGSPERSANGLQPL